MPVVECSALLSTYLGKCVTSGSGTNTFVTFNTPTLLCDSLAKNNICYMGSMGGLNALIAAIKELPNLSSLKYASSRVPCLGSYLTYLGKCVT